MNKKHFVVVALHNGSEIRIIQSDVSLNTWTRKDGGFTVRVDHNRTIRFRPDQKPTVLDRSV